MTAVPLVRRLWGVIRATDASSASLTLSASEPSTREVESSEGVLLFVGMLKGDCATMSLPIVGALPHQPRYDLFTGSTAADGIAPIVFDPPFPTPPKAVAQAVPNVLVGPVKAEIVPGSLSATGCRVKVTTAALLTGAVAALAGAAVTVTAIGA